VSKFSKLVESVRAFQRELTGASAPPSSTPPAIGLALGGGFARGLTHIGVLKVLEEENIPIKLIAGTSVGAVIGAIYCSGVPAREMEARAGSVRFKDFARWTVSRMGFANNDRMTVMLNKFLKVKTFEELQIPLAVTATDFLSGEPVIFRSGSLIDPIRASCAYPGMFLPVSINGRLMVDGMLAYSVPATPLRELGAERVIAVYLRAHWTNGAMPKHIFEIIGQCFSIAQGKMTGLWQKDADLVVEPNVAGFSYDCFERSGELVRLGEQAARAALPHIRAWLAESQQPGTAMPVPAPA
jgi:NTE family protein